MDQLLDRSALPEEMEAAAAAVAAESGDGEPAQNPLGSLLQTFKVSDLFFCFLFFCSACLYVHSS